MESINIERGCGFRQSGGAYIEVEMQQSTTGVPFVRYLKDPAVPVDIEALGLTPVGVHLIKRPDSDVWDVWDIVGESEYPNLADFIEEAARYGVSRRIAKTAEFGKLTKESRLVLLHRRAFIVNEDDYAAVNPYGICPTHRPGHKPLDTPLQQHCIGQAWLDVEPSTCEVVLDPTVPFMAVERTMPSFTYRAYRRPDGITPRYLTAVFAAFPISSIAVIRDPEGGSHLDTLDRALDSTLPVIEKDR